MKHANIIWLASYPRSGNTFLRTILWQCFGLRSGSVYPNDLGENNKLKEYVGHIEQGMDKKIRFPKNSIPLVKTHEKVNDLNPAIYVIRDGRAACVSLSKFYDKKYSIDEIIEGKNRFGTWEKHVQSWHPWDRPDTLLLKYEDMVTNLPAVLNQISVFLKHEIISESVPDRNTIAEADADGRLVKTKTSWESSLGDIHQKRFLQINEGILKRFEYI